MKHYKRCKVCGKFITFSDKKMSPLILGFIKEDKFSVIHTTCVPIKKEESKIRKYKRRFKR